MATPPPDPRIPTHPAEGSYIESLRTQSQAGLDALTTLQQDSTQRIGDFLKGLEGDPAEAKNRRKQLLTELKKFLDEYEASREDLKKSYEALQKAITPGIILYDYLDKHKFGYTNLSEEERDQIAPGIKIFFTYLAEYHTALSQVPEHLQESMSQIARQLQETLPRRYPQLNYENQRVLVESLIEAAENAGRANPGDVENCGVLITRTQTQLEVIQQELIQKQQQLKTLSEEVTTLFNGELAQHQETLTGNQKTEYEKLKRDIFTELSSVIESLTDIICRLTSQLHPLDEKLRQKHTQLASIHPVDPRYKELFAEIMQVEKERDSIKKNLLKYYLEQKNILDSLIPKYKKLQQMLPEGRTIPLFQALEQITQEMQSLQKQQEPLEKNLLQEKELYKKAIDAWTRNAAKILRYSSELLNFETFERPAILQQIGRAEALFHDIRMHGMNLDELDDAIHTPIPINLSPTLRACYVFTAQLFARFEQEEADLSLKKGQMEHKKQQLDLDAFWGSLEESTAPPVL